MTISQPLTENIHVLNWFLHSGLSCLILYYYIILILCICCEIGYAHIRVLFLLLKTQTVAFIFSISWLLTELCSCSLKLLVWRTQAWYFSTTTATTANNSSLLSSGYSGYSKLLLCSSVFLFSLSRDGRESEAASWFSEPHHKGSGKHVIPVASVCTWYLRDFYTHRTETWCTFTSRKLWKSQKKLYLKKKKNCARANPQQWSKPVNKVVAHSPAITVVQGCPHVRFVLQQQQQKRLNVASHNIKLC